MKIIKSCRAVLKRLPHYPTYEDMPSLLLFILFCSAGLVSGYYGMALAKVLPMYIESANKSKELGTAGIAIGVFLLGLMLFVYYFAETALRCRKILRDRWFK
jgi:H+/Cl- antiporter ClcA